MNRALRPVGEWPETVDDRDPDPIRQATDPQAPEDRATGAADGLIEGLCPSPPGWNEGRIAAARATGLEYGSAIPLGPSR